jgi:hypothetical protein
MVSWNGACAPTPAAGRQVAFQCIAPRAPGAWLGFCKKTLLNLTYSGVCMKRRLVLAAGAAALSSPAFVGAQGAWPSRGAVRLIAQFPPGGLIGTDYVSKQTADGYTLLVSHA